MNRIKALDGGRDLLQAPYGRRVLDKPSRRRQVDVGALADRPDDEPPGIGAVEFV